MRDFGMLINLQLQLHGTSVSRQLTYDYLRATRRGRRGALQLPKMREPVTKNGTQGRIQGQGGTRKAPGHGRTKKTKEPDDQKAARTGDLEP